MNNLLLGLGLSSPSKGGGGLPFVPAGLALRIDTRGNYVTDTRGNYVMDRA